MQIARKIGPSLKIAFAGCVLFAAGMGTARLMLADSKESAVLTPETEKPATFEYDNTLTRLENPPPILADHPEYFQPITERHRFAAPMLVNDPDGEIDVRAWRFSYNARGIVEMPNRLKAKQTAVIMVHPWGVDDGQGWKTPEPAGVVDFCTIERNHLAGRHEREVVNPFLKKLRGTAAFIMYSLPGPADPIRKKLYRSFDSNPTTAERTVAARQLTEKLNSFDYRGQPLPTKLTLSQQTPALDYFRQFPAVDAGSRYNNKGFWDLPIPVTRDIDVFPDDVVIFDKELYPPLREFLKANGIRHVLLTGYATDMCFCKTTAGYDNLSRNFNVFLVADASLATFPANDTPRYATNAHISYAALNQLVTQISWIKLKGTASQK